MLFLESLFKPVYSPKFYKKAVDKGLGKALLVFFLFSLLVTVVSSVMFFISAGKALNNLPEKFEDFPDISIDSSGVLTVTNLDEPMPIEIVENGSYIGLDTTGEVTTIPSKYKDGVLFTKTEVIIRNASSPQGDVNATYTELLKEFNLTEVKITGETISTLVTTVLKVSVVAFPFLAFMWAFFARLLGVMFIALFVWIIFELSHMKNASRKALIATMYASIPVFYFGLVVSLFNQFLYKVSGVNLLTACCLISLLLFFIKWGLFLGIAYFGLSEKSEEEVALEAQPI